MKISIIIPTYNVSKYVSRCIESCINQSYKNIEIILIDDYSTDNTFEIIESYKKYPFIRIFRNKENQGVHYTRTFGIQQSTGEYIFLLDGDDFLPLDALKILHQCMEKTNADIIDGNFVYIDENDELKENFNSYSFTETISSDEYLLLLLRNKALYQTFKLIRKKLFDFVNVDNRLTIGEDAVAIVQMIKKVTKVAKVNEIVYYYFRRINSVTVTPNRNNLIDAYKSSELVINELKSNEKKYVEEIKKIRIMNVVNYVANYHITGEYRKKIRSLLLFNLSLKRLKNLKFSLRTKLACYACFFSPLLSNKILHKKFILF